MSLRPVLFAALTILAMACWLGVGAQQPVSPDPTQVTAIAGEISQRSEHLKPMFEQVHAADWVANGAPEAYVSQWRSLAEQNDAIVADMSGIAQHPEAMSDIMKALFRVYRFDGDLNGLLGSVRRYQNPALADLIESVAAGDQDGVGKLQQYALDLASDKERQLDVENNEAQRCRSMLAGQPPARTAAPKKTNGTSK